MVFEDIMLNEKKYQMTSLICGISADKDRLVITGGQWREGAIRKMVKRQVLDSYNMITVSITL